LKFGYRYLGWNRNGGGDKTDMPKYPKNHKDIEYFVNGGKRRVAGSTKAVNDFLVIIHEENPTFTVRQLRDLITDRSQYAMMRIPTYIWWLEKTMQTLMQSGLAGMSRYSR